MIAALLFATAAALPSGAGAELALAPGEFGAIGGVAAAGAGCLAVADGGVTLVCFGPAGALESRRLVEDAGAGSVAADGDAALLVGRRGGVTRVTWEPGGSPRTTVLLDDARLGPETLAADAARPDLDGDGSPDLEAMTFEGLARWRRTQDGYAPLEVLRVPVVAGGGEESVLLSGGSVLRTLPPPPADAPRYTFPDFREGGRLVSRRLARDGTCQAWIAAGGPLRAFGTDHALLLGGDPPRLAALLVPSDKLALMGNARLIVAPLDCDETARGRAPDLLLETAFELMVGRVRLDALDVTGDGTLDLVVHGRQGLMNRRFDVAVYAGEPGGGFARRALTWGADDLYASRIVDVDGDGRLDLVGFGDERVAFFRGVAGRGLFEERAAAEAAIPVEDGLEPAFLPLVEDLDGDGVREAVVLLGRRGEEKDGASKKAKGAGAATRRVRIRSEDERGEGEYRLGIVRFTLPAAKKASP